MKRAVCAGLVFVGLVGSDLAAAGIWQDIYRVIELAATPSGFPLVATGDGTRVNGARSGRVRIAPRGFGRGYQLEVDRSFGVDSRGREETFRFAGLGEMTLSGSTQMTLGYSGRSFRTVQADVNVNNLNYDIRSQLGVQDARLRGTFSMSGELELNPLGFYNVSLTMRNANSEFLLNGVLVEDNQPMNFDVGPINIQGNLFVDGALALLTALGFDTTALEANFPRSPIDRINDAIRATLQANTLVAGTTVTNPDVAALLMRTVVQRDGGAADELLTSLTRTATPGEGTSADADAAAQHIPGALVPEPGTLLLTVLGGALVAGGRRRL